MSNQPPNNEPWQSPPPYQTGGLPPSPPQWQQPPYQQSQQPPNTNYPEQSYQQPPNTYYPQQPYQQPYQPMPPQQPPKKKSRLWLWIVLAVVAVLLFGCIGVFALISNAAKNITTTTVSSVDTAVVTTSSGKTPSTTGQVARVGETITLQNTAATLISVKKLPDDQYSPASPGNVYIVVHVKLVNNSSGEVDYNEFDFHVKSASGNLATSTYTSSYTANAQLNYGKLTPGGSVEGDIIFQTGKHDHKAQLTWQPSFFGNAGDNGWLLGL